MLLAGALYFVVGRVSTWPTTHVHGWRWAAWLVSAIVFVSHIRYERVNVRRSPRSAAFHVALAVGLGAFLLAVAGMLNAVTTQSTIHPTWFLALLGWPAFTAVPAFFAALIVASVYPRRDTHH